MSGSEKKEAGGRNNDGSGNDDDGKNQSSPAPAEDNPSGASTEEELEKLFGALRTVAREDELAVARLPAEAFVPLSAADRGKIAGSILAAQGTDARREKRLTGEGGVVSIDSRRPGRRRMLAFVGGPLAAAAALILVARGFSGDRPAPLPGYEISASGGTKELRGPDSGSATAGATAAPQRLRKESRLVAIARPDVAVAGPIAVRVFVAQAGRVEEVWPQIQIASSGAVEVRAAVAEVFGNRTGHWDLVVLIDRSETLRKLDPTEVLTSSPALSARRLTVPLEFEAP